jgi:hypothetical protein
VPRSAGKPAIYWAGWGLFAVGALLALMLIALYVRFTPGFNRQKRLVLQPEFVTWLVRGQGRGADEGGHRRSWCCANNQRSDGGHRPQRRG